MAGTTLTADEEGLIRKRLLSQTAVARINADAPLKKLTKRHERRCDTAVLQTHQRPQVSRSLHYS